MQGLGKIEVVKFSFPQSKFENFPTFYFSEIVIGKRSFFGTLNCSIDYQNLTFLQLKRDLKF